LTAPHAYPMFPPVPQWRNGRRGRLKICCLQGRAGSSPAWGTKKIKCLTVHLRVWLTDLLMHS
jgi:hypothetical protein